MSVDETIRRIEQRVSKASAMQPENRDAVLDLLEQLKKQLDEVPESQRPQAESVAGFTELSAHEAIKGAAASDPGLLQIALEGLRRSVKELEDSHPDLVQVINAISTTLSNAGF